MKKIWFVLSLISLSQPLSAQDAKNHWVDSVFQKLTLSKKIGQLFMIPVSPTTKGDDVHGLIKSVQPGFLLVTRGGPKGVANLLNRSQNLGDVPLMTAIHAERGLGQTLDSTILFQPALVQSAWTDSLNYQLGKRIATQLRMIGIHINFGPRMDVYEDQPDYVNYFSNQNQRTIEKSKAFILGLQQSGILAVAKQSSVLKKLTDDADTTLVYEIRQLDTVSIQIPIKLIQSGVGGLLTNNFHFSLVEAGGRKKSLPASLSQSFIGDILKKKFGFQGLAFTDLRSLEKITTKKKPGEIELLAFLAGNDVLINSPHPKSALKKMQKALKKNSTLQEQLNVSVRKILNAKFDAGLSKQKSINTDNLPERLISPVTLLFKQQLDEASVTVVRNSASILPITLLEDKHFISVSLGKGPDNEFNRYLSRYVSIEPIAITTLSDTLGLATRLSRGSVVLVSIFPDGASLQKDILSLIQNVAIQKQVIICHFGNPVDLKYWQGNQVILTTYSDDPGLLHVAAEIIFGGIGATGVLPVDSVGSVHIGEGVLTGKVDRLSYTVPEAAGMDSKTLKLIKGIAQEAIDNKATPGCRILVARKGKVVYDESIGTLTYENKSPVTEETIYDLASLTKVTATLQAVMFMYEKGLIDINKKISVYLPEFKNSDKKDFIIKDILTHQAGLWPFLPFWLQTMKDSVYLPEYYSTVASADYPFPVSENLFASKSIKDSLWQWIVHAKILTKARRTPYTYRYSDMGFYIMQHLAEKILNQPLEDFVAQNVYEPLGAYTIGFLPRRRFVASRIAPTENDKTFRKSLLIGYVHDQGAALHGGIAGHAGLFSDANDLAKIAQMWLQNGHYGGQQYFKPETVEIFTQKQYENSRRGLGWDRPVQSDSDGPTSFYSSQKTFGHTGFTGTCVWVDPEFQLVYIFLSNRVYPDMNNNKILNANIRPRIQDVIYRSIFNYCAEHQ